MSLINEATTARIDLPIDWKNIAVILTKHVIVINERYILNVFLANSWYKSFPAPKILIIISGHNWNNKVAIKPIIKVEINTIL